MWLWIIPIPLKPLKSFKLIIITRFSFYFLRNMRAI